MRIYTFADSKANKGHPWLPLHLLIFGAQTALTTFTALVEMLSWPGYTTSEQVRLCSLYVPYLALGESRSGYEGRGFAKLYAALVMGVDAFFRLTRIIDVKAKAS